MAFPPLSEPSVIPLIAQWEDYVRECASTTTAPSLAAFASWLGRRVAAAPAGEPVLPPVATDHNGMRPIDRVGMFIWRLSRFMRFSFKRHFAPSLLQNVDEFLLLGGAQELAAPTKTQLFTHGLLETTTGLQMLARLVRHGLVLEIPDPTDRRLKRITLTSEGKTELAHAIERFHSIDDELFNLLSPPDLLCLEGLLHQLDHFHTARGLE